MEGAVLQHAWHKYRTCVSNSPMKPLSYKRAAQLTRDACRVTGTGREKQFMEDGHHKTGDSSHQEVGDILVFNN